MFGVTASAGYFSQLPIEIPVGGTGTFYLKEADAEDGDDLDVLQAQGSGSFQISLDEPGDYRYEIYSKDKVNSARYEVFVFVSTVEEVPGKLSAVLTINEKGSERKLPVAYYPIIVVDPPVSKRIAGDDAPKNEVFHFEFRAVSCTVPELKGRMPMPAGSKGQVKSLQVVGAGETEAGEIVLERAGTYIYEFVELNDGKADWHYDGSVYRVIFELTEGEKSFEVKKTVLKNDRSYSGKTVEFTNRYGEDNSVSTGDASCPAFYAAAMLASLAALGLLCGYARKAGRSPNGR